MGIVGANGAGKLTLFKMLTGELEPDAGQISRGKTVELAYIDQSCSALKGGNNVWQEITDEAEVIEMETGTMNSGLRLSLWFQRKRPTKRGRQTLRR